MPFKVSDTFIDENQVIAILSGGTEAQFVDLIRDKAREGRTDCGG